MSKNISNNSKCMWNFHMYSPSPHGTAHQKWNKHFIPSKLANEQATYQHNITFDHMANAVVHPIMQETITKYEKLANDPIMQDVWMKTCAKNYADWLKYTRTWSAPTQYSFMTIDKIKKIPRNHTVTYACIVFTTDHRKQTPTTAVSLSGAISLTTLVNSLPEQPA